MKQIPRYLGTFAFCLLLVCPQLRAQHQARSLSGTIFDRHHEPLLGAVVQAHNVNTETVVSYITGRSGFYNFKRLDGDCDYKISAAWHNQHSSTKNLSLFDSHPSKVINLMIKAQ